MQPDTELIERMVKVETKLDQQSVTVDKIWNKFNNGIIMDVDRLKQQAERDIWFKRIIASTLTVAVFKLIWDMFVKA